MAGSPAVATDLAPKPVPMPDTQEYAWLSGRTRAAIVCLTALVVYGAGLTGEFMIDDSPAILENNVVTNSSEPWHSAFSEARLDKPLRYLTLA